MKTYRIKGPDGKNYAFEAPAGLAQNDLDAITKGLFRTPEPELEPELPKGQPGVFPSIMRGGRGIASLVGDVLPAMGAKAFGFDEYAKKQMQEAAEYQKETQRLYPAEVPSFTDIKDVGSALTYVKESIAEAIPSILPSVFTGGAAGVLSRGAQVAAKEAAEKAATDFATKKILQETGEALISPAALEGVKQSAREAGIQAGRRAALQYEAAGAVTGSAAQNIPEVYQNLYEKGKGELPDLTPALVSGGFNAVLDAITPFRLLQKARSAGIPEQAIIGAWYKRAGKGAVEGFLTEGATEAIQEMSSAAAESFVNENSKFFSPENFVRFIDAGLKGGFGGAGITAATNVAFGRKAEEPPKPPGAEIPGAETEGTEAPPLPPLVDITSKDFKRKQARYEEFVKGIQELEAKDELTSRQKAALTLKIKKATELKAEIDDALAQNAARGAQDAAGTEFGTTGTGFEIFEQPGEGEIATGSGAPPPSGVGGAGAVPTVPPVGEGEQSASLTPPGVPPVTPPTAPPAPPVTPPTAPPVTPPTAPPVTPPTPPVTPPTAPVAPPDDLIKRIQTANSLDELSAISAEASERYPNYDPFSVGEPNEEDRARAAVTRAAVTRADELKQKGAPTTPAAPAAPLVASSDDLFERTKAASSFDELDKIYDEAKERYLLTHNNLRGEGLSDTQIIDIQKQLLSSFKAVDAALAARADELDQQNKNKPGFFKKLFNRKRASSGAPAAPAAPTAPAAPPPAPTATETTVQDLDNLDDLLKGFTEGDDSSLLSASPTKVSADEQLADIGKKFGLTRRGDESVNAFATRLRQEIAFAKKLKEKPISEMENVELAGQELKEEKPYHPPQDQRALYEDTREEFNAGIEDEAQQAYENAYRGAIEDGKSEEAAIKAAEEAASGYEDDKLPQYRLLTDDARRVYFQNHISRNDQPEHDRAAQALSGYLSSKRQERRAGVEVKETAARESYNRERRVFGGPAALRYNFPRWNDLSDESRKIYASIFNAQTGDTALQQQIAFKAVKAQIRKELAEKQAQGLVEKAETEGKRLEQTETERAKAGQPAGKGRRLPKVVVDALRRGDIKAALDYLTNNAEGLKLKQITWITSFGRKARINVRNAVARQVFRNLARTISNIPDFKVNVVFDDNMPAGTYGEYDARTNTVYLSSQGMDEATLLHELTHAATVKIIHQYYTDKSKLSPRAIEAVKHLETIAIRAKPALGSDLRFRNAFDNLYEFVAYAMTDIDFQSALSQIQDPTVKKYTDLQKGFTPEEQEDRESGMLAPSPYGTSLWSYFVDTLAWLYRLFTPSSRRVDKDEEGKPVYALVIGEETRTLSSPERIAAEKRKREAQAEKRAADEEQLRKSSERAELAKKYRNKKKELEEDLKEAKREKDDSMVQFLEQELETLEKEVEVQQARLERERRSVAEEKDEKDLLTKEAKEERQLFDKLPEEDVDKPRPKLPNEAFGMGWGLTKLRRAIFREPGFRGNMLVEAAAAFENILAAPEGGITKLAGKVGEERLFSKAPPVTKKAESLTSDPSKMTEEDFKAAVIASLRTQRVGKRELAKTLLSQRGYDWFVQKFQNERQIVKKIFERAQKFGIIRRVGENLNDVWGQITRSTGMAVDLYATNVKPLVDEVHAGIEAYAKKKGISVSEALNNLHLILEARHEPERRHIKFLLNVPLDNKTKFVDTITNFTDNKGQPLVFTAEGWREYVLEQLSRPDLASDATTREYKAKQLRDLLERVVATPKMHEKVAVTKYDSRGKKKVNPVSADMFNEGSVHYNVIAGRTPAEIARITKLFDLAEDQAEIKTIVDAMKKVQEQTKNLNRESNYWSIPVQNIVDFYGYENYVPFKGRPGDPDQVLNLESRRVGGELQDYENRFEGRPDEADNPLLQTLAEGAQAAMRAGRKELTLAIKNAINDKIIDGKVLPNKIQFADRYVRGETKEELGGAQRIFHYNDDGTIEVLEIKNRQQLEAIRRSYRTTQPIIDVINSLTSGIGQTHTRYNPAFAPMNFVRDSLTNAFTLGAELGPARAGRLIKAISSEVASGGLYRSMNFAKLYAEGKFPEINRLAGGTAPYESLTEEQRYYRDLLEYVKLGGKVSYLQGVAAKGALDSLMKEVGRSGVLKRKDQIDKFFDIYNETFELAARVGAFRTLRDEFRAAGESKEEAQAHAVEYAKNLANFEQVGQWGKAAGAAFMFFRPAATGAVRAIDALRPAFGFNEKDFRAVAEQEGRTPEQIERAVATMKQEQKSARAMAAGLAGMGVAVYLIASMLSGDDEKNRNRTATDDMARWTRYARFFIPGFEKPLQIPWGFGMGAFAAAGAQIASLASGRVSLSDVASNIITIGLDSFIPLPFSRISPIDNFPAFILDSVTPSAARPFFEYVMNLDGLGREIYNNRQSKYGDAYTGGDSIPELYKSAARMIFNATKGAVDWSPNTMYFFANNYMDGAMKVFSSAYNIGLTLTGKKDFDLKNDSLVFSSFVGTKSNIDAREFNKAEKYIGELNKQVNALKSKPEMFQEFAKENPDKITLVHMYNNQVNGALRNLRAQANRVRTSEMEPGERKARLDQIINIENTIKRQILTTFETATGYKP